MINVLDVILSFTFTLSDWVFVFEEIINHFIYLVWSNTHFLNVITTLFMQIILLSCLFLWLYAFNITFTHDVVYRLCNRHVVVRAKHELWCLLIFDEGIYLVFKICCCEAYVFSSILFVLALSLWLKLFCLDKRILVLQFFNHTVF